MKSGKQRVSKGFPKGFQRYEGGGNKRARGSWRRGHWAFEAITLQVMFLLCTRYFHARKTFSCNTLYKMFPRQNVVTKNKCFSLSHNISMFHFSTT